MMMKVSRIQARLNSNLSSCRRLENPSVVEFESFLLVEGLGRLENPGAMEFDFLLRVPHEHCLSYSRSKTPISFCLAILLLYSAPR